METLLTKNLVSPNISGYIAKNHRWFNYVKLHYGPEINFSGENFPLMSFNQWSQIFNQLIPEGFNYVFSYPDQDVNRAISLLKKYVICENTESLNDNNVILILTQLGFNIYSLIAKDLNIPDIPHYKVDFLGLYGTPIDISTINLSKTTQEFQNMEKPMIKVYNHRCLMKINVKYIQYFRFFLQRKDTNSFWSWIIKLYDNQPRNSRLDAIDHFPDPPPLGGVEPLTINNTEEDNEIITSLKTQYKTMMDCDGITNIMVSKLLFKTLLDKQVLLKIYNIILEESKSLPIIEQDPIEIIPKPTNSQSVCSDIPDENDPNWSKLEFGQWRWSNGIIQREYVTSPDGDVEFFREIVL